MSELEESSHLTGAETESPLASLATAAKEACRNGLKLAKAVAPFVPIPGVDEVIDALLYLIESFEVSSCWIGILNP